MRSLLPILLSAATSFAADTVLVVVNSTSSLSRNTAEYYARRRDIPRSHICSIAATRDESIDRATYEKTVEAPVGECLRRGKLTESVLYLVLMPDVPLRVTGTKGPDGDNASVDSELTLLYGKLHGRKYPAKGIVPNPFFRRKDAIFRHPEFPVYLVTRLAAYDFQGVKGLVDRAIAARNRGVFVLDSKSDKDEKGDDWLRDAAIALPSGRTVFDETEAVVTGTKNVIGYASWGSNDPARKTRGTGFTFLPGAVMTEYVSTNARTFRRPPKDWKVGTWKDPRTHFAGSPQTLIADYIAEGVTGVAGHVDEPYLALTPRPDLLLPAWHSGRNLAESFYLAIPALSWQNVVVGDPLCSLPR